jgi:hypothetical protein
MSQCMSLATSNASLDLPSDCRLGARWQTSLFAVS